MAPKEPKEKLKAKHSKAYKVFIFSAIILLIVAILGSLLVYCLVVDPALNYHEKIAKTVEIVRNIGLLLVGVVGLPLTIWRSRVADEQKEEALRQGERAQRQLEETEQNNLTELLAKGTEFIQDTEDNSNERKLVGVSILYQVALKNNGLFREEVEQLYLEHILKGKEINKDSPPYKLKALENLSLIQEKYNKCIMCFRVKVINLSFDQKKQAISRLYFVCYKDCMFFDIKFSEYNIEKDIFEIIDFERCSFIDCEFHPLMRISYKARFAAKAPNNIANTYKKLDIFNICSFRFNKDEKIVFSFLSYDLTNMIPENWDTLINRPRELSQIPENPTWADFVADFKHLFDISAMNCVYYKSKVASPELAAYLDELGVKAID